MGAPKYLQATATTRGGEAHTEALAWRSGQPWGISLSSEGESKGQLAQDAERVGAEAV